MPASLPRRFRALAVLLLLALAPIAGVALPAAAGAPATYSEEDLRLIHEEAVATGGLTYTFYILASDEQAVLENTLQRLRSQVGSLKQLPGMEPRQQQAFALPAPIREQLRRLARGERSPVFALDRRNWAVVELEATDPATPVPGFEALRQALPKLVTSGAVPEPRLLASDPLLAQRRAMNRAQTTQEFDRLPPGFDIDQPLSSGITLLQRALARDEAAMVTATLVRAANPNLCPLRNCPLHLAVRSKTNAGRYVAQLLGAGAQPDQVSAPGEDTALTLATMVGELEAARALLAGGADRQGGDSPNLPLGVAAYAGHRELMQLLLDKGADPLARKPARGGGFTTPVAIALAGGKPELAVALRNAARQQAAARKSQRFQLWIEQDGERIPVVNNRASIRRKPFTLLARLPAGAELRLEAATSPRLFDDYKAGLEAPLYQLTRLHHELRDGSARTLLVGDIAARNDQPGRHGGLQSWTMAEGRRDFSRVERTPQGPVYAREIETLVLDEAGGRTEVPVARTRLRELALLAGIAMDYSPTLGDLANAQRLRITFDRPDPPPVPPPAPGGTAAAPAAGTAAPARAPRPASSR